MIGPRKSRVAEGNDDATFVILDEEPDCFLAEVAELTFGEPSEVMLDRAFGFRWAEQVCKR